jgi:hypothetical protein
VDEQVREERSLLAGCDRDLPLSVVDFERP